MTDSMNFGPDWIRNLSSEGTTGGGGAGGTKYQLADYRYGREEMLALFDKNLKPPISISNFKCLYSDTCLQPLALLPVTEEEQRVGWQGRPNALLAGPSRGRGGSLERGGRISRGRGYQYGRPAGYEAGWGNGEQPDWSPRKDYANQRTASDNWRRVRSEEDEWRNAGAPGRSAAHDKWTRSMSWRGDGDSEERTGPPERGGRAGWADNRAGAMGRKSWENDDHLPEWATENPTEGGGTFDEKGAFHNSDDEQPDVKPVKKESGFQKSVSLHQMSGRNQIQPPPMLSSKSVASLKLDETCLQKNDTLNENVSMDKRDIEDDQEVTNVRQQKKNSNIFMDERKKSLPNLAEKVNKEEMKLPEGLHKHHLPNEKVIVANGPINIRPDEPDFERLQEEYVLKLVVDEDLPKQVPNNYDVTNIQPPPNLATTAPILDKWYYQDPQGQMQGPFSNAEMAEWYKAGYFSNQLKVRRQCDERFYLLGELIGMCAGANPFQSGVRFPVLKGDNLPKIAPPPPAEPDMLPLQYLSQMAAFQAQAQARLLAEPWNVGMPPPELAAQRLMMQQQVTPDIQYLQQQPATNPLMHMINQMQQVNKLPGQGIVDKNPSIPPAMDAHMQLHNLLSMQNRLPGAAAGVPGALPAGLTNLPPPEGLPNIPIQSNIPVSIGGNISMPRPTSRGSEQIPPNQNPDPISSLLKQLQQQQQQQQQQQKQSTNSQVETLWQQNSFNPDNGTAQWQSQNDVPVSMWDIPKPDNAPALTQSEKLQQALQPKPAKDKEKEQEALAKELKKKKELEEKQAKKEEEKRKQEQKRLEAERKMLEEKKRKEEERIKKELEKAKREAEEKRLRELEEKRRLKEQRKLEEEARKKAEEMKKLEEEKLRQELKEKEARRQEEEKRLQQEHQRQAKAAPWCQANSNMGLSLAEIQKAEREKRAIDAALQIQRQQQEKEQQQQSQQEKTANPQFNWAKKPVEARKVKSLAEIQAEEQEKLSKQVAESRLHKEKEPAPVTNNTGTNIWSSQNLTWASSSVNWSNSGFWDDSSSKQQQPAAAKPSAVTKSNSASNFTSASKSQPQKPAKAVKPAKKEEAAPNKSNHHHHNNNNEPSTDEFMSWCYKTLSNISTNVDIPTFVTFLRDIESAYDVKEYCKEYLGDNNATHQFALNFLEKRRSFKPKNNAHKDDMCAPAPAITPSLQHSTEFQEVKGKNKKNKKSKMTKVDSRILGFNVTSAPDRINVGDRDYGDTS
ncbi:unnamed protein product [Phyllotreta striolata]|uniref:GYF domain-containing protein n=1 Tax=Phyllotreta striolata TaxID=444603 RepID=A0A9N9U0Z4_PHYSR|nr:unnamed protein product [Phyllotreta striolata]